MHPVLIVDANNLIARHAHSHAGLTSRTGEPTGSLYGSLSALIKVVRLSQRRFSGIILCYDAGIPRFRLTTLPAYKAKRRKKAKDTRAGKKIKKQDASFLVEYYSQLNSSPVWFATLGIGMAWAEGYEADDVAAFLVRHPLKDFPVVLYSNDKDWTQLVCKRVRHMLPDGTSITKKEPCFLLRRSMVGDSSDEISGVPQIGEKKADAILAPKKRRQMRKPKEFLAALGKPIGQTEDGKDKFDPAEMRVLEHAELFKQCHRVMDLRYSAKKLRDEEDTCFRVRTPTADNFRKLCGLYSMGEFLMRYESITKRFKEVHRNAKKAGVWDALAELKSKGEPRKRELPEIAHPSGPSKHKQAADKVRKKMRKKKSNG